MLAVALRFTQEGMGQHSEPQTIPGLAAPLPAPIAASPGTFFSLAAQIFPQF